MEILEIQDCELGKLEGKNKNIKLLYIKYINNDEIKISSQK